MMPSDLELEVAELRARVVQLEERVRVDAVAEAFLAGNHDIRERDYFLRSDGTPFRLDNVSSDGRWTYGSTEYGRIPDQRDFMRLYTIAEVAEIVAKAARGRTG